MIGRPFGWVGANQSHVRLIRMLVQRRYMTFLGAITVTGTGVLALLL